MSVRYYEGKTAENDDFSRKTHRNTRVFTFFLAFKNGQWSTAMNREAESNDACHQKDKNNHSQITPGAYH